MTSELHAALDNAYIVFGSYKDEHHLARKAGVSRALRELTRDDWHTMENEHDMVAVLYDSASLCHFLPRWLEWLSEGTYEYDWGYMNFTDLARRLKHAGWLRWSAVEVAALREVFKGWARRELAARDGRFPLEFLLDIKDALPPYLDLWLAARPFELAHWLQTVNWQAQPDVLQWATSPRIEAKLEEAFFAAPDKEQGRIFSHVVQLARALRGQEP